jgi:hypothetical protein
MPYIDWKRLDPLGFLYTEGRARLEVMPDMDNSRWYWVVRWSAYQPPPIKGDDGSFVVQEKRPQLKKWGIEPTEEAAKKAAEVAFGRGRNA